MRNCLRECVTATRFVIMKSTVTPRTRADAHKVVISLGDSQHVECPIYYVPGFEVTWTREDGTPLPDGVTVDGAKLM